MFPWTITFLREILVGRPQIPVIQGLLQAHGNTPLAYETLKKLLADPASVRRSTLDRAGIGFLAEIFDALDYENPEGEPRALHEALLQTVSGKVTGEFIVRFRSAFPDLISAILWTETFWERLREKGAQESVMFGAEGPLASFPSTVRVSAEELSLPAWEMFSLVEHHYFMLYAASFQRDVAGLDFGFAMPLPEAFVPTEVSGKLRMPMWRFWTWLRERAECKTWGNLGVRSGLAASADGDGGEQQIRNFANEKAFKKVAAWSTLRGMLRKLETTDDPLTPFKQEIHWAYGQARILQVHAMRCLPTIEKIRCHLNLPLDDFYGKRIEACTQNECGRIPPHSEWFA